MKDQIRSLFSVLEQDPTNESAMNGLEEIVTGDDAENARAEISADFLEGRRGLVRAGHHEAACQVIELELAITSEPSSELELLKEQARIYEDELFDQRSALQVYQKALGLAPGDEEIEQRIDAIQNEREKWKELVEKYLEYAEGSEEPSLKAHMLYSAAERTYKNHKRGKDIPDLLKRAIETDPTHVKAARLLEKVLRERGRFEELAEIYTQLSEHRRSKNEKLQMLLASAQVYETKLEDNELAAVQYSAVLDLDPSNESALTFLVDYYESEEKWDHLVAVYEDALNGSLSKEDEMAMLMQAGMVHWKKQGAFDKADTYFRQLRKLDPSHKGMIEFYRAYADETGDKTELLQVLNDAQRNSVDPQASYTLTSEIAQLAATDGGNVERAIDAYKEIVRNDPNDEEAKTELKRLYRESEKWNALLDLLKSEADNYPKDAVAARVAVYEEIAEIYKDQLSLGAMVIKSYKMVLDLDPSNENAQLALTETFEKEKRWNDLINLLSSRAKTVDDPKEKIALLSRAADLWTTEFNNFNRAVAPLEEILAIDPTNAKAITSLKQVYTKRRAWRQLVDLLEKEAAVLEGDQKRACLEEMAKLCIDRLSDHNRSIKIWREVLSIDPSSENALNALEKLTERTKDWKSLCEVIEIRIGRLDDPSEQIALLSKLGTISKDRLKDKEKAAEAWQRILQLEPGHPKAVRSLKETYLAAEDWDALELLFVETGDFEGLVETFGIAADRTHNPEIKKKLSFKCAEIYNNQIGQPDRAVRHYERILAVDENNEQAARALVPIYKRTEKWNRLVQVFEVVLAHTDEQVERAALMDEMREVASEHMNNRNQAFEWAARAFAETPTDEGVRQTLEEAAETANAFEELVELYQKHLDAFDEGQRLELERHIATICLERLGMVDEAVAAYRAILEHQPGDAQSIDALENIFKTTARFEDLVDIYDLRIDQTEDRDEKRSLLMSVAELHEEGMDQIEEAQKRYRAVLDLDSEDREAMSALERIARVNEDWENLAGILMEQRNWDIDDDKWRSLVSQLASLYDKQLNDPAKAIGYYEELLERFPGDETTIAEMEHFLRSDDHRTRVARILEPHLVQVENWRILAWVLAVVIEDTEDDEQRLALQFRLSEVYDEKLSDTQLAFETLGAALKERPENQNLWERMTVLATQLGEIVDLADRLEDAYTSADLEPNVEFELARRLAEILDVQLGRSEAAAPYHARVFETDPHSKVAFTALETFYTAEADWDALITLYQAAIDGGARVEGALELQLKICFVLEEIMHNVKDAIAAYRIVLEMSPGNPQAVNSLMTLYEEVEGWPELAELLLDRLPSVDRDEQISIRFRLGEINEFYLDKKEEALEYYEQVLIDDPNHLKAQEALERLLLIESLQFRVAHILENTYEAQGAAEPLARVLMIEVEEEGLGDEEQIDILTRVADLRERRLGETEGAFEVLARAFKLKPSDDLVRSEIKRIVEEHGFNAAFATVLDGVIPTVEDDKELSADLIATVAHIYDVKLDDYTRAEAAYRALLDLDPSNSATALPAIAALDRMLSARESFSELLTVLRQKAKLVDDLIEKCQILHRMAEIEESVLGRGDNAIALFAEILELDDTDLKSLAGLERLYEQKQEWPALVNVLRRRSDVVESPDERRNLLFRIAELYELKIENIDDAIAAYNQVNLEAEAGADRPALAALARLYTQNERWPDLLEVYEIQEQIFEDNNEKVSLSFRMGDLLRTHLNETERAVEKLGETLKLNPTHEGARQSLEALLDSSCRRQVIDLLRPVYEAEANYDQILKCDEIMAAEVDDPFEQATILKGAAMVAEAGLSDAPKAFELLGRAFRVGASSPDMVEEIVVGLERLAEYEDVDGTLALVELYREVTPDILDGDLQIQCYLRVAQIAHKEINDTELARDYFVKVLDIDGENMEAMDSLESIYEAAEQYIDLFEIYRRKVQRVTDPDLRESILFKQAAVCETHLDDVSGAISTYETILESSPDNDAAMKALERLYPKAELWTDLMNLLETRSEMEPDNRADILFQLGTLAEEKLGDEERALEYFNNVLSVNPTHEGTLSALESAMEDENRRGRVGQILEPVYKLNGNWAKLVKALEARLEYAVDLQERKQLLAQIGAQYEDQLDDLDSAFETYARLFKEDIEDSSSREALTRLASVLEIWPRLAAVYAGVLDDAMGDTPTTAELAFVLGDIYERTLNDLANATAAYKRALAFNPEDERAFEAVERVLLATESWDDLLELYRDATEQVLDLDKRKSFMFKIADIQEGPKNDPDAAINAFMDVLEMDARDDQAINALDRLYRETERFEDLAMHLRMQIDGSDDPQGRNALRCRLGVVYKENTKDLISAVDIYEEALHEEEGNITDAVSALEKLIMEEDQRERIADILEPVYRASDEWKKLIVILQTKADYVSGPPEKAALWKEVADINYDRGNDQSFSFDALGQAFRADPSDRAVLSDISELVEKLEVSDKWVRLTTMLSEVVEEIYDMAIRKDVLHILGATYDARLDAPREAITAYQGVLEIDESDSDALSALEGLYNLVGDWEGLVGVLEAKANYADDPLERAEILRTKATIHEDLMSSPEDAVEAYRQALDADPVSTITMDALERLYETSENWHDLVEIKRQRAEICTDGDQKLDIMRSVADVLEKKIDDAMDAISVWRDVLEDSPEDPAAIAALDRLYTKESLFVELLENLELQKMLAKDQALHVEICSRIGQLQEKEMQNLEGAIDSYRDVLLEHPTHAEALAALTRLAEHESVREKAIEVLEPIHRDAERYDELVAVIELKLEIIEDPFVRLSELLELAKLHEVGRSDPKAAFDVFARALAEDPSRSDVMDNLERIAEAENFWKKLTAVYMERADNAYDPAAEWALLKRVGQIREQRLRDVNGAIDALRRALDGGSMDVDVMAALDRLYQSEAMWPELDEILEREIEMAQTTDEINAYKLRQGTLRSREFEDVGGALEVLREVIESDQSNIEAQNVLESLLNRDDYVTDIVEILTQAYEFQGDKEKLGALFEHRLRVAMSESEKVQLYKELALHHEERTEDLNAAFDAYLNAFRTDPGEVMLLDDLERLAAVLGSWTSLVDSVEAVASQDDLDPVSAVELGLKVAGWAANNVGDPRKAELLYRKVIEKEPSHMEALVALEELLRGLHNFEGLIEVMNQRADAEYDYQAKKTLYMEIAEIARRDLEDVKQAKDAYLAVRDLDETDADALDALIAIAEEEEDFDAQVDYLVARSDFTADPIESNRFLHKAAAIYLSPLEDADQAIEMYRRVLEKDPVDREAADQSIDLLEKMERFSDLREFLLDQISLRDEEDERIEILRRLATLDETHFESLDDAIGHLNEILYMKPEDEGVNQSLKRLYHQTERWQDLADLLENQVDQAHSNYDTDTELSLLVEVGDLLDTRLYDTDRAKDIYQKILEQDSEHTKALSALARLYEASGEWESCAEVLNRAANAGRGGPDEAEVHYRLARLYENQMDDKETAVSELNRAVELDPTHQSANEALLAYFKEMGDHNGIIAALHREEAYTEEAETKAEKLIEIANIQMGSLDDREGAVDTLERAKELTPTNTTILLKLSDAYIRDGRETDAIPVLEALIDAETAGGKKRSKKAAVYHQSLAAAYISHGDQEKGLEHLEAAYKLDISNVEVLLQLGQLYYQSEAFDQALKLFRALLLQRLDPSLNISKADIYFYVGDISLRQGDPRKAKGMFRRGLDENPNHDGCKQGLAQCQ